jgi:hypothetical protein
MPSVLYGAGTYERTNGNFPELTLVNMFLETGAQTSEGQTALLSRPGLGQVSTAGTGPIHALFMHDFGNQAVLIVTDDDLYIINNDVSTGLTSIGTIAGSGHPTLAGGGDGTTGEVLVTRGTTMRSYKYTSGIADVTFPDTADVRSVCFIGGMFVAVRGGQVPIGRFYWSDLADGRTWDALNFATAERETDYLVQAVPLGDNLVLFGSSTIEAWAHTGEADLPFTRLENVFANHGLFGLGAVTPVDGRLVYVGSDRIVRTFPEGERISDHSIEQRISNSATCILFSFKREGHEFVAVRLAAETLIYDATTGQWTEFQTDGAQWIAKCALMVSGRGYFGHESTNQVMGWDEWDDLGDNLTRTFTAAVPLDVPQSINSLRLWANSGQTPITGGGAGTNPTVDMRYSRDAGNTWTSWESVSLGAQTEYRVIPEWRTLGMFDFPGALIQFRCTDPVPFRVSKVAVNDPGGGRSR